MMLAFGAAASALDSLFGLASAKPAQAAGSGQDHANLFAFQADAALPTGPRTAPAAGGGAQISPETMSALLAAQSQSGSTFKPMGREDALKHLFSQIDADSDGQIASSEFEDALGAGGTNLAQADEVFGKLDRDSDGFVSLGEMASALKGGNGRHHGERHMANGVGDPSTYNFLDQLIQRQVNAIAARTNPSLSVSA